MTTTSSPGLLHQDCRPWPLVSVKLVAQDISLLEELIKGQDAKTQDWKAELSAVSSRLTQEVTQYDDVVMVDMVDVYRNLPVKLVECHRWLFEEYRPRFVMKTDDDVYVRVKAIVSGISGMDADRPLWWGSFRREWRVDRHGKWQEDQYSPEIYPDFACGSGNVMSGRVHAWVANNADSLNMFQGEDVSMGIWLSPFHMTYIDDSRWRCDQTCSPDFLSLPQLDIDSLYWYGNTTRMCLNPCQSC